MTLVSNKKVGNAIRSLGIEDFVLYGEPKNEKEFNSMFRKVVGKDSSDSAILSSNPSDFGDTWSQVAAKIAELEAAEPLRQLRIQRNNLLSQTDWRMTTDYPYSDQAEWASYRTQLRNLPQTSNPTLDENGNLVVDWPQAPSQI